MFEKELSKNLEGGCMSLLSVTFKADQSDLLSSRVPIGVRADT